MRDGQSYKDACDEVLLSRAGDIQSGEMVSLSRCDTDGQVFSREHRKWQFMGMWAKVATCMNEGQRAKWFLDNPEPKNKYI